MALCAGAGGLELGLHIALPGYRTVGYVEREAGAAATLVARMADASLDTAPVWDDVATFDGRPWRGIVDLVSGGYPCQGESNAGRRRGVDDPRWMWPHFRRILDDTGAEWGFFENVGPHLSRSFPVVLDDLQGLGYRVAAGLFTAFEAGASHQRERLFILAHSSRVCLQRGGVAGTRHGPEKLPSGGHCGPVEHPTVIGGGTSRPCRRDGPQGRHELDPTGQCLEDAAGLGWEAGGAAHWTPKLKAGLHSLSRQVATWPTPQVVDCGPPRPPRPKKDRPGRNTNVPGGIRADLKDVVAIWPTPAARDWRAPNSQDSQDRRNTGTNRGQQLPNFVEHCLSPPLARQIPAGAKFSTSTRRLNPRFVEWLMQWPIGWTDCGSPVTGFTLWLLRSRSALCTMLSPMAEAAE
ncbi:Site-specific DNA methylase [Paramagnetospirillum magneticum AMB-1]|uniref:Site-specific DNA methylase n=1 Tax=Paramagnetospirillum magneticum (strain ATCC 700264 / AMB-1) TaxID=342108 RepID=Q2W6H0_PARM1|nr:Site-specific DNA methylase [Paramagnetospirillum magneticum AMB-1]